MKLFDHTWLKPSVADDHKRRATAGHYDGWMDRTGRYLERCRGFHQPTGSFLIFTRDARMHTSGWWKNPEYERCFHLSLSFWEPGPGPLSPRGRDGKLTLEWLGLFFGRNRNMLWCEPPVYPEGRSVEVWHYRLFCSPDWHTPLLPRKEVYSREFTPAGWKSFSDVQAGLLVDPELTAARLKGATEATP